MECLEMNLARARQIEDALPRHLTAPHLVNPRILRLGAHGDSKIW